jgi:hypothetical protein
LKFHETLLLRFHPQVLVTALEKHKDGGLHIHACIVFANKRNIKDPRYFDIFGRHCNIQAVKNLNNTLRYITKESNYLCFGITEQEIKAMGSGLSQYTAYLSTCPSLMEIHKKHPDMFFRYPVHTHKFLEVSKRVSEEKQRRGFTWPDPTSIEDTTSSLILRHVWMAVHKKRPIRTTNLYIHGPPKTGKSLLFTYLNQYFKVYFAPQDEQFFDGFSNDTDIVVFDEFQSSFPATWVNSFCTGHPMSIRQKGAQLQKTSNPLVVILSNLPISKQYARLQISSPPIYDAFKSRFVSISLKTDSTLFPLLSLLGYQESSDLDDCPY